MSFLGECNVYSDSVSLQQSVDHEKSLDVRALLLSFSKLILSHGQILPTIHIYKRTLRDNSSLYEYIQWAASVGYLYKEQKAHRLFMITLDLQRKEHYWFSGNNARGHVYINIYDSNTVSHTRAYLDMIDYHHGRIHNIIITTDRDTLLLASLTSWYLIIYIHGTQFTGFCNSVY